MVIMARKKKLSGFEKFLRILLVATAIVFVWRGIWGIADVVLLPNNYLLSSTVSLVLGIIILYITHTSFKDLI
jgi:hypothetical protein